MNDEVYLENHIGPREDNNHSSIFLQDRLEPRFNSTGIRPSTTRNIDPNIICFSNPVNDNGAVLNSNNFSCTNTISVHIGFLHLFGKIS